MTQLELFIPAKEPTAKQHIAILNHLRQGFKLTGLDGLKLFGTMKLASRISELKADGWNIKSRLIKTDTRKTISEYWI